MVEKREENELELLPLSEAAKLTGYTPEYLNLLSRKGKLKAKKIGRNWHTKKEWIDDFLATMPRDEKKDDAEIKKSESEKKEKTVEVEKEQQCENEYGIELVKKEEDAPRQESVSKWNRTRILAAALSIVIVAPMIFAGTHIAKTISKTQKENLELYQTYFENEKNESGIINENTQVGKVAGEEIVSAEKTGIVLASENFRVKDINLGGGVMILANGENVSLEIGNIKSESFVAGKKEEVKLVISWATNKLASSELSYSKNNGQSLQVVSENSYGFIHSAVISGLDPRTSYIYKIKCKDHWGNEKQSDFFGIYTSSKPVSVFDLISNAMGDVFGWALKK